MTTVKYVESVMTMRFELIKEKLDINFIMDFYYNRETGTFLSDEEEKTWEDLFDEGLAVAIAEDGDPWKLYIWDEVLCDYTCGMAFAIARTVEEAIKATGVPEYNRDLYNSEPRVINLPGLSLSEPIGEHCYGGG